ncbi:hypothetical protein ACIQPT_12380 [Streptomyces sp. NPDC091289]|uniref:hypothetical protein n=1 Tax=Streptomyces sp. NPDC091289 TaxID=3365989 RepID=UPI0037FECAC7
MRSATNAGAAGGGATTLGPRASLLMSLSLALLLGALSMLVMFPAAEQLRSLRAASGLRRPCTPAAPAWRVSAR